jgi:hypothetical protein
MKKHSSIAEVFYNKKNNNHELKYTMHIGQYFLKKYLLKKHIGLYFFSNIEITTYSIDPV